MRSPDEFEKIDPEIEQRIIAGIAEAPFPKFLGLRYEEIRKGYARMRLPYRPELNQPAGIIHGGAIASLIDTSVVAVMLDIAGGPIKKMVTLDMHIHYLDAGVEEDLLAHAFARRAGGRISYLEVEVVGADSGKSISHGELCYMLVR